MNFYQGKLQCSASVTNTNYVSKNAKKFIDKFFNGKSANFINIAGQEQPNKNSLINK